MIERILIANRGEIALRAIRTIKEMGKKAIAVYSKADKDAHYLQLADAAICIGGEKSNESYLNIPAIISAAEIAEADAIFPGYGFLSENQQFVEICNLHGIKFIGPSLEVMQIMSDKSKAKEVMKKAGVPVIPGSEGAVKSVEEARKVAKEIGYPVILKAASGGGGKGMRVVENESYIENAFLAAESEAISSFGDGTIYIEKFIKNPRHIEVQLLGDSYGNVIHLGERDCSLQRRHQKVLEESPATFLDEKVRKKLHQVAVKAAKAIKYESAGTIEFLVDADQNFYFMEMNTRLQVEHPVSEMVTGIDIVEQMIRIAEGEKLFPQREVKLKGHAIECRINAEDPQKFIPSPGKIKSWIAPGGKDVRIDSHAYCNYIVPPYYDSMIAKVIVWGEDRERAIKKMKRALEEFEVRGIKTTIEFHKKIMENPDFLSNNFDTKYIDEHYLK
ncbi:MAG: acetyl-CoA carboxylase biotin carboxylase subunit [Epsilonproteobacteria bacterium]|nr:acetyl-CoA carboxylase biotin carboxylase subunit [Campylobacterota bacterium]